MATHPIVGEMFQSGSQWSTDRHFNLWSQVASKAKTPYSL